ncbi:MAG TPA: HAMP domain-containing sensor histidine kinase [Longimicrobium sp.]|nr:HAMP domain-containing sensor histidine kinase [Longimicrobium sp.]
MDRAMRRAARRLAKPFPGGAGPADAAVADVLHGLAGALPPAGERGDGPAAAREARRRLRLLQRQVEREWLAAPEPPTAHHMLRVMRGFRDCRRRVAEEAPPPLLPPDPLEMLTEVAHDLRSPLTSILFLADTLQRGDSGPLSDLQRRQIELIYGAALRLSSLASDVVEMAQPGDRLVGSNPVPFSVTETLYAVRDMVMPMAEEKRIDLRAEPPAHDRRVGHPAALGRVLLNLVVNALKYTHEGFVEMRARSSAARVLFVVRDTGPGLPAPNAETVFEPFRPAAGGERQFSGTGLGLAISRRLVRAMGSELRYQTCAGHGTEFYFSLHLPLTG